jgi:hypothetical protein
MPSLSPRTQQWDDDERQLEEVQKERQHEHQDVDDDQEAELSAGKARQQVLDPLVTVYAVEAEAEDACADQDEDHERSQLRGRVHRLPHELHRKPSAPNRHDESPRRAHRAALGRRGHAEEDGAEHEEDERERRDQHERDALGELRQEAELQEFVEDRKHERNRRGHAHADHEPDVGGDVGVQAVVVDLPERDADRERDQEEHAQRPVAGGAVRLAQRARLGRQGGNPGRLERRDEQRIARIEARQHDARDEGARVHVAHRAAELVGHDDEHERRRDDLRKRSGGGDGAGRKAPVVAVTQHDRQRDEAHRDDRRGHDTGRGGKQRADEDDRVGEAAANGPNTCPMVSSRSSAIPLRSRIRPMKVKNGTASRVSLDITPQMRSGSAPKSDGERSPSSMPIRPNTMPFAARAKATGYPSRRKTTSAANISGAMLAAMNAVMA